jgi:hypothetical protein
MRNSASQVINPLALSNNAAPRWFKDPGLRSLAFPIVIGFASTISAGTSSFPLR